MEYADFVIIGSGIAGLRAAIELAAHGQVTVLTKSKTDESNTEYAQGGIAVAMSDEDEIGLHYRDTIQAGDGLCSEKAVDILVEEGPARIQELIDWGTRFDREGVRLAFTREAAHSRKRILHAQGDSTGHEINRTLVRTARASPNIRLQPYAFALQLLVENGSCQGVSFLERKTGRVREMRARAVLLATGGIGMVYRETTNPPVATGDGYALAFRAGALLADMEFVQFHPTALKREGAPHFLLSEAIRGEGGVLRNQQGETFMSEYHPLAELAPRDIVSRSIFREAQKRKEETVFLDVRHLDANFIRGRFPRIYETCLAFGLDITSECIPVYPAAHYMMGGVYTDLQGRTSVPALFAAGEVACNGVHGANRLASNSLLEGLVYGARAGRSMLETERYASPDIDWICQEDWQRSPTASSDSTQRATIASLMSQKVGMARAGPDLTAALEQLDGLPISSLLNQGDQERNNLRTNAELITRAALLREESRGSHYRSDYPEKSDRKWRKRLVIWCNGLQNRLQFGRIATGDRETAGAK